MTYYLEKSVWNNPLDIPEGMNLDMVNDEGRLHPVIFPSIDTLPKNKIFLDAGCGSGMIGLYALKQGAKFVYFLEQDPQTLRILENTLHKLIPKGRFVIISKDIEDLTVDDFKNGAPHFITSEFYGPTLFDEGYVHYTKHLRSLFPKAHFIPEHFETRIFTTDIDYSWPLWPHDHSVLEQYKFMYSEKGYISNNGWFVPEEMDYVDSITYDANRLVFKNLIQLVHKGPEKLVYCQNVIHSKQREQVFSFYGWYLPASKKKKTYEIKISLDNETIFQPIINVVDNS